MSLRSSHGGLRRWGDGISASCFSGLLKARVLLSTDYGASWSVAETPIDSGSSAGIFALAFRDDDTQKGVAVGGDYTSEDLAGNNVAVTEDGGASWALVGPGAVGGLREAVAYIACGSDTTLVLALGPSGADLSRDDGRTWVALRTPWRGLHTYSQAHGARWGWGAGAGGAVAKFVAAEALAADVEPSFPRL